VLDDGWFGKRDSDSAGLGDYTVNRKKLPQGITGLAGKIHRMGLLFGLWFEPEMVNADSDLFRAHPEYALRVPGRRQALGRHQLVLDLCNPDVRAYIVENVSRILDEAKVDYVKWDCNRHISDAFSPCVENQGEFFHRYMLGLYDVLSRIFRPRPHILFESCASGGNRFDLGMLCFSPQVWTSDDTDPVERLSIQGGISCLYPLSTMGAHVSDVPHQQTLRVTPLPSRFHAACFGCLGYEMDLRLLTPVEKKEIRRQIAFYKEHRALFQYGSFRRISGLREGQTVWQVTDAGRSKAVTGVFQALASPSPPHDILKVGGLDPDAPYTVESVPQRVFLQQVGGLAKHLLPFAPDPDGFLFRAARRLYALENTTEKYRAHGSSLARGIELTNRYMGSGYNEKIRVASDFSSALYLTVREEKESE